MSLRARWKSFGSRPLWNACWARKSGPTAISGPEMFRQWMASPYAVSIELIVIEDIKAGNQPSKTVRSGQCSQIMTGAPVPEGADAAIRVEDTRQLTDGRIEIQQSVNFGNDI